MSRELRDTPEVREQLAGVADAIVEIIARHTHGELAPEKLGAIRDEVMRLDPDELRRRLFVKYPDGAVLVMKLRADNTEELMPEDFSAARVDTLYDYVLECLQALLLRDSPSGIAN